MTEDDAIYPNLHDLAASIGKVQIYWSFLETEMRNQLKAVAPSNVVSRGPTMSHWRKALPVLIAKATDDSLSRLLFDIDQAAAKRNILAHGIQSASGDPSQSGGAFVVCAGSDDVRHTLHIADILALVDEIDRIRLQMRRIDFAPSQ